VEIPVSWEIARSVGVRVAQSGSLSVGRVTLRPAEKKALESDFAEASAVAEEMVERCTGLASGSGPVRAVVVDRPEWVEANVRSFRQMMERAAGKISRPGPAGVVGEIVFRASSGASGLELGALLGWMSGRVLGQYDMLISEGDDGGVVSYVGPNVVSMERRYGFPPKDFRLWIALHEMTHRAQFTGVPWLREHFLDLVDQTIAVLVPDPARALEVVTRMVDALRRGEAPVGDLGFIGLVLSPEQRGAVEQVQALMSLLEGHGDVTMDRAGAGAIPEARWFSQVLRARRRRASPLQRLAQQATGIGAKMRQYQQGEAFVRAVEAAGGSELFATLWRGPEWLPTLEELKRPELWLARVGMPSAAPA